MPRWRLFTRRERRESIAETGFASREPSVASTPDLTQQKLDSVTPLALVGRIDWPQDPFYRPTIGVVVDGHLDEVIPTFRRPPTTAAHGAAWPCVFELPHALAQPTPPDRRLICLETGDLVRPEMAGASQSSWSADDSPFDRLIEWGIRDRAPWNASGFAVFLTLSLHEQLDLIYRDVLGRAIDDFGYRSYRDDIVSGRATLLSLRDTILRSEEFKRQRLTRFDQVGKWIVWSGLRTIARTTSGVSFEVRGVNFSALFDPTEHGRAILARRLADMALGQAVDEAMRDHWIEDHAVAIDDLFAEFASHAHGRRKNVSNVAKFMRIGGLIARMRAGDAGVTRATGSGIDAVPGRRGCVAFGPYLSLLAGRYVARMELSPAPTMSPPIHLTIEVVYDSMSLARGDFVGADIAGGPLDVPFSIAGPVADRLAEPRFEFRLISNGGGGAITLREVTLLQVGPGGDAEVPAIQEWLSAASLTAEASRDDQLPYVWAPSGSAGHVIFGPYRSLLPGRYRLTCLCQARYVASDNDELALEVTETFGPCLALYRGRLVEGENCFDVDFEVVEPDAASPGATGLPPPLEFRLSKKSTVELVIQRLFTARQEGSDAA